MVKAPQAALPTMKETDVDGGMQPESRKLDLGEVELSFVEQLH